MIVSIASRQETRGRQRCLWVRQKNFCAYFANKPHKWMIFIRKANLVLYLLFLLIMGHWEARRVPRRHSTSSKTWCHGLSLISNNPPARCEHLCIIFSASAPSGPNLFSITGIKVMTSGIAFDRSDRLSLLRAFPYDRFKIYMIVPIVRIELNSIQAIEVVSVVRVVCDRLGSVSIWSSRPSEHFLRRLGRSRRSGRSYGNQAFKVPACVGENSGIPVWLSFFLKLNLIILFFIYHTVNLYRY